MVVNFNRVFESFLRDFDIHSFDDPITNRSCQRVLYEVHSVDRYVVFFEYALLVA